MLEFTMMSLRFYVIFIILLIQSCISFAQSKTVSKTPKRYYSQWRKDANGCNGIRATLLDKIFSTRVSEDKRYIGFTKQEVISLFGSPESDILSSSNDIFTYHLSCKESIWCIEFVFVENKVSNYFINLE